MTPNELMNWLGRHGIRQQDFANLIGVTPMAVNNWTSGRRSISLTIVRLCKLFDRKPELLKEFAA